MISWEYICVDVVGQYMLNGNNDISYKFMCVTTADPAMSILKIEEPILWLMETKVVPRGIFLISSLHK